MQLTAGDADATQLKNPLAEGRGLEERFDPTFVARLALREKQVQQSYRPVISIHKWFARRPGSVFRGLILAEFVDAPLQDSYWQSNKIPGTIADPFMGGGTTVFEALRVGLSVVGCDINPMAYWLVRQAVEPLDLPHFRDVAGAVWRTIQDKVGDLYTTACRCCKNDAPVKYFIWAKTCPCPECGDDVALHPGYRVADAVRHPREVYHCPTCRSLTETEASTAAACATCHRSLAQGNTKRGKTECLSCGAVFAFAKRLDTPPRHRLLAIEYQCPNCYPMILGRQFKAPDTADFARVEAAKQTFRDQEHRLRIPEDIVPTGDETDRLHRWGYHRYRDMFNERQLLGLGLLLDEISSVVDTRIRHALATVFSDFLRYQNLLCRYDTYALKCQDIFSVHGFPVGLTVCENNLPGIAGIGSGSFIHFVEKFANAKSYTERPYETSTGSRKTIIHMLGEQIETPIVHREPEPDQRSAWLNCAASQDVTLSPASLDGVFTDPPYFDNVQYAELMDFCFVWLRELLGFEISVFERTTTRTTLELTGNATLGRGLDSFTDGLSKVFCEMSIAMKPGAPLAFTFHHNDPFAYAPLVVALLDAGMTCTAVLPAPAEMAASLHIAGTKSSILDSIFICRDGAWLRHQALSPLSSPLAVDERVVIDCHKMADAGYQCTVGDRQCLRAGHIASDVIRSLGDKGWDPSRPLGERLQRVSELIGAETKTGVAAG